ncbi:hypothetical protein MANES_05G203650v8 [Manihot esculenta]|uniref:Uncharacterized protein n=1 Tax=Manihot esculenta TaxID=3983 RepID=A0ACB7HS94_MANES|nr:hypothetical protein MANES_05G203650v8 [Manihot esculenta]
MTQTSLIKERRIFCLQRKISCSMKFLCLPSKLVLCFVVSRKRCMRCFLFSAPSTPHAPPYIPICCLSYSTFCPLSPQQNHRTSQNRAFLAPLCLLYVRPCMYAKQNLLNQGPPLLFSTLINGFSSNLKRW